MDPERVDQDLEGDAFGLWHQHKPPGPVGRGPGGARVEHDPRALLECQGNPEIAPHLDLIRSGSRGDQVAGGQRAHGFGHDLGRRLLLEKVHDAADGVDFGEGVAAERNGAGLDQVGDRLDQPGGDVRAALRFGRHVRSFWSATGTTRAA